MEQTIYYANHDQQIMYKLVGNLLVDVIQIKGRDLTGFFSHRHERVTFPSQERLAEDLAGMKPSSAEAWQQYVSDYLQINKEKLSRLNEHRQQLYDKGQLKL
jgi:hypothetical protein